VPRLRLRARPGLPLASAISAAAGLALSAAFPPIGAWPVAFVALAPLLWLSRERPGRGFVLGLAFGLTFHGATLYWILRFGEMAWVSLTLVSALWVAAFGALLPGLRRPGRPVVTVLAVASAWTVLEWLKGMWPLGGFTWGTLGISQVDNVATARLGTVAGVWGVTFAVVATNAAIALALEREGPSRGRAAVLGLAAILVVAPLALPFATAQGQAIDVAAIQIDVREAEDGTSTDEDLRVAELNIEQHQRLVGGPVPDLVVWGEGALDPGAVDDPGVRATVSQVVAAVGAPTIIGAVVDDPDGSQHTSVLQLDGSGNEVGRYDKTHLVPFGEYVPFRSRLEWVDAIDQVPVDRVPGDGAQLLSSPGLPPFATPICYENSFPAITRSLVSEGTGFVVVPVNNASYGFTAASAQHLQMSQMRAIENGRWYVNAAISGISAFIEPSGAVVSRTDLFATDILRGTVRSSDARTPFVRLGDWFSWCSVVIAAGLFLAPRRRASTRPPTDPSAVRPRILVIVPTYDERATIADVVRGVLDRDDDVSVLVVDDASPDGTAEVVRAIAATDPRVRLLEREAKGGLAGAYLAGFRIALEEGYDLVVEMDADLSHEPADLGRLLLGATRHDVTIGSRYVPGGSVTNWSRLRLALSKGGNAYARFMLGLPIRDATSGYRVFRREVLERLLERPIAADGYGFQVELVLRAWRLGYDVGEVPITFREREHGQSKLSRGMVVEALWLVMRWGLADRFREVDAPGPARAGPAATDAG